jgi:Flp pilus assembly protein TadG
MRLRCVRNRIAAWLIAGRQRIHKARRRPPRDQGSATVELAMSLPALVLLVFASLTAIMAVRTQLECLDAAREAARAAARGESGTAAGARVAPAGASVSVAETGADVHAVVRVRLNPLGGRLPGFEISATAVAAMEPSTDP